MRTSDPMSFGTRLDPGRLSVEDGHRLQRMRTALQDTRRAALVDATGRKIEVPEAVFRLLCHVVEQVSAGRAVQLFPEHELVTTQAAANLLGVSRPHLVKLLETQEIPFQKVGTHRRIRLADIAAYARKRSDLRREALGSLTREIQEAGLYDR
jgi:excisionase family DNA binding protein